MVELPSCLAYVDVEIPFEGLFVFEKNSFSDQTTNVFLCFCFCFCFRLLLGGSDPVSRMEAGRVSSSGQCRERRRRGISGRLTGVAVFRQ
jgi:hypothetical protein